LRVTLQEHKPVAYWGDDGEQRMVNSYGEVFEANAADLDDDKMPRLSGPDSQSQQVLAMYKAKDRFSSEKASILRKWKMDKSCKWVATYQQEKTTETIVKGTVLEGYGTRCGACTKSLGEHDALIMFVDYSLLGIAHSCFLSCNLHVPGLMWPRP
jgi:hypothetical protein